MTRPNGRPNDDDNANPLPEGGTRRGDAGRGGSETRPYDRRPNHRPEGGTHRDGRRGDPGGWMVCSVRRDSHRLFERCHAMLRSLRLQRRRLESLCRLTRLRCQQTSRQLARCEDCPFAGGCPTPAALDALRAQVNQELGEYS